jgi:catechol 2,3-dioxygenase-like lactoylglutathione lyase family enzyme
VTVRRVVPNVSSTRPETTRDFYIEVLGFEVGMDMGWIATLVSPGNPTAQLSILRQDEAAGEPELTVEVGDVDRVHALAVARGADIVRPLQDEEWGVRRFFVRDPDGRVINVMSHRAPG